MLSSKIFVRIKKVLIAESPDFVGSVPVEIGLTPLNEFCSSADAILINFPDSVTNKVSEILVELNGLDTYIRTLVETRPAKIYPAVVSDLNLYRTQLTDKSLRIKEKLQELLPALLSPFNKVKKQNLSWQSKSWNKRSWKAKAMLLCTKNIFISAK